jgi:hypothetical protein
MCPGILPDEDLVRTLLEEIGTTAITSTEESPVRCAQNTTCCIVKGAELIAALSRYLIHRATTVQVPPDRLRGIPHGSILKLDNKLIHPQRIAGIQGRRRSKIGAPDR